MLSVIVHVLSTSREAASPLQPRGRDGVPKPSTGGCEGREAEGRKCTCTPVWLCVQVGPQVLMSHSHGPICAQGRDLLHPSSLSACPGVADE